MPYMRPVASVGPGRMANARKSRIMSVEVAPTAVRIAV